VSISPTFYEQLLCQNPFAKKLQTQIVSTEKLCKKLLYEKAAHKILVQLTALVSDMFCNYYLVKNHKIADSSATTEARHIFGILSILEQFGIFD
jgi:hypothetical protein